MWATSAWGHLCQSLCEAEHALICDPWSLCMWGRTCVDMCSVESMYVRQNMRWYVFRVVYAAAVPCDVYEIGPVLMPIELGASSTWYNTSSIHLLFEKLSSAGKENIIQLILCIFSHSVHVKKRWMLQHFTITEYIKLYFFQAHISPRRILLKM